MKKNIAVSLTVIIATCTLFVGILIGTFIGRITDQNANKPATQKQHTETLPNYTYPFQTNQTGKINVNTASADELTMLPGIGTETAKRIIEYRTKYGIFYSLDELTKVKGIGENTVEKLKPYATVGG